MSVRRLAVIALAVVVAGTLVLLVEAPPQRTGEDAVSGPHVVRIVPARVSRVAVAIGERHVEAMRTSTGWFLGERPASPPLADALSDLVQLLATLRAVDRFRPGDGATFGFDPPRAVIEVDAGPRKTRVVLGELNAARSAVYARRDGGPRVYLVGLYLVSALERVIYFASVDHPDAEP